MWTGDGWIKCASNWIQEIRQSLSIKIESLMKNYGVSRANSKRKNEKSQIQLELEEKLTKDNLKLITSHERSVELESDQAKVKAELERA